ncbi:MAG TPA: ABC transporter permease [Desulfatiglandales bacterium]|nr:ABC transporter permease [Desulfatiglandales bacterium]
MEYIAEGLAKALELIFSLDREIYAIVGRSVRFALTATLLAAVAGVPLGFVIGSKSFKGKPAIITLLNTLMALPTVVVGLLGYAFLSRRAPLGFLDLIFSPHAVILGEFLLSLPVITNLTVSAVQAVDKRAYVTAQTLGASRWMVAWTVLMEARFALLAAIIAGFGRAVSEVGSAMMLGGNIRYYTRTMTTAIALEVSKGEFGFGLALGFFLLAVAFSINIFFHYFQVKGR